MTGKDMASPQGHPTPQQENQTRLNLLTHDIRSAVFDVIGGLRQVDSSAFDAETQLQLERIRTSGEVLARLVEDALHIVEDGHSNTEAVFANLHLHRLLQDVEYRWAGRAHEKGLKFALDIDENIPPVISTDRLGLERILSNLVSNALKYSAAGEVRMQVTLGAGNILQFDVTDTGPGFSPGALSQLFTLDGRPQESEQPGTGLGLHIAKQIADRMGATLEVKNLQKGAQTTLILPARAWHYATTTETSQGLPDLSNIRVLLAEDNASNQLIIAQMLEVLGAEYEIASDGVEALNWLERERFDIALLDIDMPRLTGIEVMRHLRAQSAPLCDLPVLAITAFVLRANRDAIFEAGADRILAKPILNIDDFGRSIAALLNVTGLSSSSALPTPDNGDNIDETLFHNLMDIAGPTGRQELLTRLCSDLSKIQAALKNTENHFDRAEIRGQSHVLISLAGAVGAIHLQHTAEALNTAAHQSDASATLMICKDAQAQLVVLLDRMERERQSGGTHA